MRSDAGLARAAARAGVGADARVMAPGRSALSRMAAALLLAGAGAPAAAQVAGAETLTLAERRLAPWTVIAAAPAAGLEVGATLRIEPQRLVGPAPLACTGTRYRFVRVPAQGLFEGSLPPPAERGAAALGVPPRTITQRIVCANASFDLHRGADGAGWLALDGEILRWTRTALAGTPEAVVQALLLRHLGGDAALSPATIDALEPWLGAPLREQFRRWFARHAGSGQVPDLDGDPFTDSQEEPVAFELAPARVREQRAEVEVRYEDEGARTWRVTLLLSRAQGRWRVDDVRLRDGQRVSRLLAR